MRRRYKNDNSSKTIFLILLPFLLVLGFVYYIFDFILDNLEETLKILTIIVIVAILVITICIIITRYSKKLNKFIFDHSIAVKELSKINDKYSFDNVHDITYSFTNDNEIYFSLISPVDYLIYELQFQRKTVKSLISSANRNAKEYQKYADEVKGITSHNKYDADNLPFFKNLLFKREKSIFKSLVAHPSTSFSILVNLNLTNIRGYLRDRNSMMFSSEQILKIIDDMSDRTGEYYNNEDIWQSICKIERAKVTNKIRFHVFNRDGNRCVRCGSYADLEVDHIYPVSKGGKSNVDNLQTLCHRCNSLKSNKIEYGAVNPRVKRMHENTVCPLCGAPTIIRYGKRGNFLACTKYPNCKFTKSI